MLLEVLLEMAQYGIDGLLYACWDRFSPRRCPYCGEPMKQKDSGQEGPYCPHCGRRVGKLRPWGAAGAAAAEPRKGRAHRRGAARRKKTIR